MDKGKQGEQLFSQIMQSRNYLVEDVSGNPQYWDKDIDFIITSPASGLTKSFEVKWDSRIAQTGNLFLETDNIHSKCGRGWFEFCEADVLAYGDATNGIFYMIDMKQLKKVIGKLPTRNARCGNDSVGILVSLESIKDLVEIL